MGTAQRGKLSADQYRLWGSGSGHRQEMLRHYMDLVSAVQITNLRVVSQEKITAYNDCIFRYTRRWPELFPNEALKPMLHAALHVGDFMDLFGPVQAYSSPFYERYINFFHCINTNKKIGK
ncbi:hypothetical protein DXG01_014869 [Tephrocybe rancida]|nr:hypothetical protein DXG01_014869 [Tephrocybe rancida]